MPEEQIYIVVFAGIGDRFPQGNFPTMLSGFSMPVGIDIETVAVMIPDTAWEVLEIDRRHGQINIQCRFTGRKFVVIRAGVGFLEKSPFNLTNRVLNAMGGAIIASGKPPFIEGAYDPDFEPVKG